MNKHRFTVLDADHGTEWSFPLYSLPVADDLDDLVDDLNSQAEEIGALFDATFELLEMPNQPFYYSVQAIPANEFGDVMKYWAAFFVDSGYHIGDLAQKSL